MNDSSKLMATFRPQCWLSDSVIADVDDGKVEFDATDNILQFTLENVQNFKEHNYDSDHLAIGLKARDDHNGPFEVDVDIDDWLLKNGIEGGRSTLTQEQWQNLKNKHKNNHKNEEIADPKVEMVKNVLEDSNIVWGKYGDDTIEKLAKRIVEKLNSTR